MMETIKELEKKIEELRTSYPTTSNILQKEYKDKIKARKDVLKLIDGMYDKLEIRSYKDRSGEILRELKQKIQGAKA